MLRLAMGRQHGDSAAALASSTAAHYRAHEHRTIRHSQPQHNQLPVPPSHLQSCRRPQVQLPGQAPGRPPLQSPSPCRPAAAPAPDQHGAAPDRRAAVAARRRGRWLRPLGLKSACGERPRFQCRCTACPAGSPVCGVNSELAVDEEAHLQQGSCAAPTNSRLLHCKAPMTQHGWAKWTAARDLPPACSRVCPLTCKHGQQMRSAALPDTHPQLRVELGHTGLEAPTLPHQSSKTTHPQLRVELGDPRLEVCIHLGRRRHPRLLNVKDAATQGDVGRMRHG